MPLPAKVGAFGHSRVAAMAMCAGLGRTTLLLLLAALVHGDDSDSCAAAQRAPLRISPPFTAELNALRMVYSKAQNYSVRNAGNRLALEAVGEKGLGFVDYKGKRYTAEMADFRSPAEHVLGATRPPVELQLYHHDDDGKNLAISLLFRVGTHPSKFVDRVLRSFNTHGRGVKRVPHPVALLDFGKELKHSSDYFSYSSAVGCGPEDWGHPPMNRWIVLSKMKRISALQLQRLRRRVPQLSRTTRSMKKRQVTTALMYTKAVKEDQKHTSALQNSVAHVSKAPVLQTSPPVDAQKLPALPQIPPHMDGQKLPALQQVPQPMAAPAPQAQFAAKVALPSLPQARSSVDATRDHMSTLSTSAQNQELAALRGRLAALLQPGQAPKVPAQSAIASSTTQVPQFTPEELNMASIAAGAPDDLKVVPTTMPSSPYAPAQKKRPVAGLLQQGNGAMDATSMSQDPSDVQLADPQAQAALAVSPTFVPPPPFYDVVPTGSPDGYGSGAYSKPQPSLMFTDSDLQAQYRKGFNQYLAKEPEKDRMVGMYREGGTQQLPSLDALGGPIASPDVMPNVPIAPPQMQMGGIGGGMPGIEGSMPNLPGLGPTIPGAVPGLALLQRQEPDGVDVKELLKQNDLALKKHFGSKGVTSFRPTAALLQGQDAGLAMQAGTTAEDLMQQAQYQQWLKDSAAYQRRYGGNGKSEDVKEELKNRMATYATIQQQQQAMDHAIVDAMQQPYKLPSSYKLPVHKGNAASMLRVNSAVNNVAQQQYNAEVAAREKAMWSEYHNLEQESKELTQMQKDYKKVLLQREQEQGLYQARSMQDKTLWTNFHKQQQNPGWFLGPVN